MIQQLDDRTLFKLFGAEDAENEDPVRLKQYFFRNKAYQSLSSDLPIRILIGHKGVGKSALLKMAYLEDLEKQLFAIWVRPDDIRETLDSKGSNLNLLIDAWKKGLIDVVFRKAIERLGRSQDEEQFGPTRHTLNALLESVRKYINAQSNKVIDATAQALVAQFLKNQTLRIYIDDLDRGWQAKREDILNISALLNAIRDLCGADKRLQIRLGLRSDVYFLVRTSDESTDKIERNLIWLTWTNHEILTVIAKRVATFMGKQIDDFRLSTQRQSVIAKELHPIIAVIAKELHPIIEGTFRHAAKWDHAPIHRVLLSLTRRRPRDLIKLLYGGGKEAFRNSRSKITTIDLRATFEPYSNERLQDIVNEFKTEMSNIGKLVHGMRQTQKEKTTKQNYLFTNDELMVKLRSLISMNDFRFTSGEAVSAKSLAEFLYKIDFITARKDIEDSEIIRYYFDQNRYLQSQFADYGFRWEIHPAYRWALQPGDAASIFKLLDLSTS
jgi:hypothetical protein